MNARFRVRLREGDEFTVETLDAFFDLVSDGTIGRRDLIHDALTGEWAPAGHLPVYWLCVDLAEGGGEGAPQSGEDPALRHGSPDASPGLGDGGPRAEGAVATAVSPTEGAAGAAASGAEGAAAPLQLTLAPPPPEPSPAEAARAFITAMEKERMEETEAPGLADLEAVAREAPVGGGPVAHPVAHPVPPTGVQASAAREAETGGSGRVPPGRRALAAQEADAGGSGRVPPGRLRRSPHRLSAALAVVLGSAGVFGGVGLAWPDLAGRTGGEGPEVGQREEPVEARDTGVADLDALEAGTEAGAARRMRRALMELAAIHGIADPPPAWLEGRYLAGAASYPEVQEYWQKWQEYLRDARDREEVLFAKAYLEALDEAGVFGPPRSLRLARAMSVFRAGADDRRVTYDRLEELAAAALALHTLSVTSGGRIRYEPARGGGVSADPVIEAAGVDAASQAALEEALDRVLLALYGREEGQGPGRYGIVAWFAARVAGGG